MNGHTAIEKFSPGFLYKIIAAQSQKVEENNMT